jgi:hypothetical protein
MEFLSTEDLQSYRMEEMWPDPLLLEIVAVECPKGILDFGQWISKVKKKTDKPSTVQFQPASDAEKANLNRLIDLLKEDKAGHQCSPQAYSLTPLDSGPPLAGRSKASALPQEILSSGHVRSAGTGVSRALQLLYSRFLVRQPYRSLRHDKNHSRRRIPTLQPICHLGALRSGGWGTQARCKHLTHSPPTAKRM